MSARSGILNIDKPPGMTSHDVVGRVRRALKTRRVGHAGTLDPDAVGVLVIAVGQATRLLPLLPLEPKVYVARLSLGVTTDTEDAAGQVLETRDASAVTESDLRAVLPRFAGEIDQIPPMVSAVHHQGRRLYELAREGVTVERAARRVTIHSIDLTDFAAGPAAEATLRVACGGGTYIRTLCADIGAALGVGGHMKSLVREAVGPFRREEAVSLERLAEVPAPPLLPMAAALGLPEVAVDDADSLHLGQGQPVAAPDGVDGDTVVLTHRGELRALARRDGDHLQPFRVFAPEGDE